MTKLPSRDEFAAHLNSTFRLHHETLGLIELELESVSALQSTPRQQMFSILLRGPFEPVLEQRIYALEHDQLGTLDLFLVPVEQRPDGTRYEAVFNRLLNPPTA
jgi:hypothetical protein